MHAASSFVKLLLFAGIIFLISCGSEEADLATSLQAPVEVTVMKAGGLYDEGVTVSGKIEAGQSAGISTRLMGTINRIFVKVGDRVHPGQVLVGIQAGDIVARKAQAEAAVSEAAANLASAQKDFERYNQLYNKKSASAKELDNATLQYNAARAKLEVANQLKSEAGALLRYSSLTAPFAGTITQKLMDEGAMASPGIPILTIEADDKLTVAAYVSEAQIGSLHHGDPAQVLVKSTGKQFSAAIAEISRSSTYSGGQYLVKLNVPATGKQTDLYPGMYVAVTIQVARPEKQISARQVLVPISSLVYQGQLTGLYTVSSSNTALLRWVRTGKTYGDQIEVLSGLKPEESFISNADGRLFNGIPVTIKK